MAVEQDSAALRIHEAQEQVHQRRLAGPGWSDHAQGLTWLELERAILDGAAAASRIAERDVLEDDHRPEARRHHRLGRWLDLGCGIEQVIHPASRRHREHAAVEQLHQIAQGAEDFDPEQQNHQQCRKRQLTCRYSHRAPCERNGGASRDPQQGDAAGGDVDGQHPHGAAIQVAGTLGQLHAALTALTKRFERGQALDAVEEVGGRGDLGVAEGDAGAAVPAMKDRRQQQRKQRKQDKHDRHLQIEERHEGKDQHRRQRRDHQLGQVLAEKRV